MRKKIAEIIGLFSLEKIRNDRRVVVFTLCLLFATALWFLNALGKDYSTTLRYSVRYINPPKDLFLANAPPSQLDMNVEAHGITLLRHKVAYSFSPLVIDLADINNNLGKDIKTIQVPAEILIRQISNQISKEISINDVTPGTITLVFDNLAKKTVPVFPSVTLEFKPQFNLTGKITTQPESIMVSGPAAIIDTLTLLRTEPKIFSNLDTRLERVIRIEPPTLTELSTDKVTLILPVEKFTEKSVSIAVRVINKPEELKLKLFPPQVSVVFMVGLSKYEEVSAGDFSATVDFNQVTDGNTVLDISIESAPPFIQLLKVSPGSIEYLIESE